MASNVDIAEYICDQISPTGYVRYKKMFGDFIVYLNDRPIFLICDNTLFVKICPQTTDFFGDDAETGYPYKGAKLRYIVEFVDDRDKLQQLANILVDITPLPKRKNKEKKYEKMV